MDKEFSNPRLKLFVDCELEYLEENLCPSCKFYDDCKGCCKALEELAYLTARIKFLLEEGR